MTAIPVLCPHCQSDQVVKRGKTAGGKQRYRCLNPNCSHSSFVLNPAYLGRLPEVKEKISEMALSGSGVRDTARVLKVSTATVIRELRKRIHPQIGQQAALGHPKFQRSRSHRTPS